MKRLIIIITLFLITTSVYGYDFTQDEKNDKVVNNIQKRNERQIKFPYY